MRKNKLSWDKIEIWIYRFRTRKLKIFVNLYYDLWYKIYRRTSLFNYSWTSIYLHDEIDEHLGNIDIPSKYIRKLNINDDFFLDLGSFPWYTQYYENHISESIPNEYLFDCQYKVIHKLLKLESCGKHHFEFILKIDNNNCIY